MVGSEAGPLNERHAVITEIALLPSSTDKGGSNGARGGKKKLRPTPFPAGKTFSYHLLPVPRSRETQAAVIQPGGASSEGGGPI